MRYYINIQNILRLRPAHCAQAAAAERSYPTSKVRGSGLGCQDAKAQEQLRGATARPRSGATVERSYPASEVGAAA